MWTKTPGPAARVIEAEYEWPFQSHSSMGPGCGIVESRDGQATVWTGSPKLRTTAATAWPPFSSCRPRKVEARSLAGAGSYGRNDAGDACMEAAVLARAVGKPVRVQYARSDGTS